MNSKPLTFGSLFAGIGGFDLGFERAGMVCKWQVEIDDYANRVLAKHWPNVRRWPDVRTWPQPDTEQVDVICGGFPCQDISYAGQGAGLDGERSGLFFEAVRVVRELRPRIVVLENVAALLTRGLDRVLGTLAEIGFDAEWHCIPAAAVGAPHIRDRVFVLAYAKHDGFTASQEQYKGNQQQQRWKKKQGSTEQFERGGCGPSISNVLADTGRDGSRCAEAMDRNPAIWSKGGVDSSGGGWWKTEPNVGRVANGIPARAHRLRGLGNAVVPQVAEWIGRQIVESVG